MDDRRRPPLRNPSRTAAKFAVAVLVVIAIAGFVLAGLRARNPAPEQVAGDDATQQGAAPPTAAAVAPSAASAEDAAVGPNAILFAPKSDQLSESATAKVRGLAETARKQNHRIGIVSKAEAGTPQVALAQQRVIVVRQVLEKSGIPLGRMHIEVSHLPAGVISPAEANRVEVVMR